MELQAHADRLAHLLETRLDVRGSGLKAKLARVGRRMPRHLQAEAKLIVEALEQAEHPKLSRQVDHARLDRAFKAVERHLLGVDPWSRRKAVVLDWLAGNAFNLLLLAGLVIALLAWRGLH